MPAKTKETPKYRTPLEPAPSALDRLAEAYAWTRTHSRALTVGTLALGLALASAVYYVHYTRDLEAAAAVALEQPRASVQSGNTNLALNDLRQFLAQYGSTRLAREARVMLATVLLQAGQPREAYREVRDVASKTDDPVGARAALVAGAALEAAGDTAAAIRHYLAIADRLNMTFQKRDALAAAARLQELAGDYDGAAQTYARIVQLLDAEAVERPYYEMRLAEMRTRAGIRAGVQSGSN